MSTRKVLIVFAPQEEGLQSPFISIYFNDVGHGLQQVAVNRLLGYSNYSMNDAFSFLDERAEIVAPRLLGSQLIRELDGHTLIGTIVEVEAYDQMDAASHSYKGKTPRTEIMFGPSGHLYVYFTYGMHHCMNIVTGPIGYGSAVLIRAIEPILGQEVMSTYRHGLHGTDLTNGPAKLCQALRIDKAWNGHDLHKTPLRLAPQPAVDQTLIMQTTRIGISQAKDVPWRYYIQGNSFVSQI